MSKGMMSVKKTAPRVLSKIPCVCVCVRYLKFYSRVKKLVTAFCPGPEQSNPHPFTLLQDQ